MMPLVAVNTTAGTASEMTRFAIITDHARKVKMAIIDWYACSSSPQKGQIKDKNSKHKSGEVYMQGMLLLK